MFYLENFYKSLFSRPLIALLYVTTLLSIGAVVVFEKQVAGFIGSQKVEKKNPYFYAVVPADMNTSYIQRKLKNLPGVEGVALLAKEQVGQQVKSILENTLENSGIKWDEDLSDLNYAGLKVALSPDLKARSQSLIRNYLSRLAGGKDVTMGAVKKPLIRNKKAKVPLSNLVLMGMPALMVILYMMAMLFLRPSLGKNSFLLETYQRKSKVFEKSLFFGQAPLLALLVYAAFFKGTAGIMALGFFLVGILFIVATGQSKKHWI